VNAYKEKKTHCIFPYESYAWSVGDGPLDYMLVDYNMEEMDGLALCKLLRQRFPAVRGALVTANVQDALRQRAELQGISFINKPVNHDTLMAFLTGE
jgi:CheY-like chemotaxis protein